MVIPRVLAAGASAAPADGAGGEGAPAAEARPGERLAALDRGRLLGRRAGPHRKPPDESALAYLTHAAS